VAVVSFKHKGLRELFEGGSTRRIGLEFQAKTTKLLDLLDAVTDLKDLQGVSDFHALKGRRKGEFSLHVNGNWCLTFKFKDGEVLDLSFEDYH
jgi:toxin HigB-1